MKNIQKRVGDIWANPVARNGVIVMAGSMVGNVIAYLYHLVVGRILGPERYGELGALLSLFYLLNVPSGVLLTVLTKYFSIFKARGQVGQAKTLLVSAVKWVGIGSALGLAVAIITQKPIAAFLHLTHPVYVVWLYLVFASYLLTTVNIGALQGYQRFLVATSLADTSLLLRLGGGGLAAFFGVGWTLFTMVITNILGYVMYFIPFRKLLAARPVRLQITRKDIFAYSTPTLFAMLGINALYSQDVVLVKHFFTSHEAGLYASLAVLGKIIFFASSSISLVMFPVLAEQKELNKTNHRTVYMAVAVIAALSLVLSVFYYLFPVFVIHMLFGSSFDGAAAYLGNFGVFISLFSLAFLLVNVNLALGKTFVWVFAMSAAVVQTVLLWFFHQTIASVIYVNMGVAGALFVSLLLYYRYGKS